jgi:hypothetical protein
MNRETGYNKSRRGFIKKLAFVPPAIVTLSVIPSIASAGSPGCNNGPGNGPDCLPPGLEKNGKTFLDNDDIFGTPGNPQNKGGPN